MKRLINKFYHFYREKMSDKRNPLACELAPTDELVAAR
jgi:hypothetical protein